MLLPPLNFGLKYDFFNLLLSIYSLSSIITLLKLFLFWLYFFGRALSSIVSLRQADGIRCHDHGRTRHSDFLYGLVWIGRHHHRKENERDWHPKSIRRHRESNYISAVQKFCVAHHIVFYYSKSTHILLAWQVANQFCIPNWHQPTVILDRWCSSYADCIGYDKLPYFAIGKS